MEKINISNLTLPDVDFKETLGCGRCGCCFRQGSDKAIKIMHDKLDKESSKSIEALAGIKNKTFVFPETLVYEDDYLYGYLMPFIDGLLLSDNTDQIKLKVLGEALQQVYADIKTISDMGITGTDIAPRNMILNKIGEIKIIDTDLFIRKPHFDSNKTYRNNIITFNDVMLWYIMGRHSKEREELTGLILTKYMSNLSEEELLTSPKLKYFISILCDYIFSKTKDENITIDKAQEYVRTRK